MNVIELCNINKVYKYYSNELKRILSWFNIKNKADREYIVLKDISFMVEKGDSIGILGENGAGKSTLLKIITGTTQPTSGNIITNGRISAILELGMGFNNDFTGKDNAINSLGMMGFNPSEIMQMLPYVESFADIGAYFNQPIRTYSSGMQARLAFSVATAFKPDILIIDEVLSVGDIKFQSKCMLKINEFISSGVTIFFVSHSMTQVRQLCNKAIMLKNGEVFASGDAGEVCDIYQNSLVTNHQPKPENAVVAVKSSSFLEKDEDLRKYSVDSETGSLDLEFMSFGIYNSRGEKVDSVDGGENITLRAVIHANTDVDAQTALGLLFGDKNGFPIMSCNTNYYGKYIPEMKKDDVVVAEWNFDIPFMNGEFRIDIGLKPDIYKIEFYDRVFCAGTLTVVPSPMLVRENFGGIIFTNANIKINRAI